MVVGKYIIHVFLISRNARISTTRDLSQADVNNRGFAQALMVFRRLVVEVSGHN